MNTRTARHQKLACLLAIILAMLMLPSRGISQDKAPEAAIELGAPFRDNAILQREKPVPVWGWSKPDASITVHFAGQKKTVVADKDGAWMVKLDPLQASAQPAQMVVSDGDGKRTIVANILVGEVWHASGQSNMEWFASKSLCGELARDLSKSPAEVPIREFRTDTVSALYPQKRATSEAGWKTSRSAGDFSALALAFANELHKELKVPVGILLTSHSNTRIEAFTERKAIEAHPLLKGDADMMRDGDVTTEQGRAAFEKYYRDLEAWQKASAAQGFPVEKPLPRPELPGIAGQWRGPSQFFNGKIAPVVPYAIRGSLWCQGEANEADLYAARMEALVNGWRNAWGMPEMPFYFTQMQSYGAANSEAEGFAGIRQAQHLFFTKNRNHVGMVVQTDLNPANPGGIHYSNKLHPGMRLARWALANEYGKDVPFTGPIYAGYRIEGNKAVVSFEPGSLFGGLMVGSKGLEKDIREPGKFVEPALPTPGEKLTHFKLCGKDRQWRAADAVIVGDTVVVTSRDVPAPVGVQYAYSAAPVNPNLYNKAGLPATPFAAMDGGLYFEPAKEKAPASADTAADAAPARQAPLTLAAYYRDGAIIQRDKPVPVWGFASAGAEVTVTLAGVVQKTKAGSDGSWAVSFPPMKASSQPVILSAATDQGQSHQVQNILVGDVWFLTGTTLLGESAHDKRQKDAAAPEAMLLVREFKRNTKASTSPVLRKRSFEIGGDRKYRSVWQAGDFTAEQDGVTMFAYHFARGLNRPGIPQAFVTMSSGQGGRNPEMASPLSWTSFAGVKDVTRASFLPRVNALLLQNPASDVAKKAVAEYLKAIKAEVAAIVEMGRTGADLSQAPLQFSPFPEASRNKDVPPDTVPTLAFNWCVSPLTPMAVAGVIWVPGEGNIGYTPEDYAAELETYARSLPATYGQEQVPFLYAQPAASLVKGITEPAIPGAKSVNFSQWPKTLKDIATQLGAAAATQ